MKRTLFPLILFATACQGGSFPPGESVGLALDRAIEIEPVGEPAALSGGAHRGEPLQPCAGPLPNGVVTTARVAGTQLLVVRVAGVAVCVSESADDERSDLPRPTGYVGVEAGEEPPGTGLSGSDPMPANPGPGTPDTTTGGGGKSGSDPMPATGK